MADKVEAYKAKSVKQLQNQTRWSGRDLGEIRIYNLLAPLTGSPKIELNTKREALQISKEDVKEFAVYAYYEALRSWIMVQSESTRAAFFLARSELYRLSFELTNITQEENMAYSELKLSYVADWQTLLKMFEEYSKINKNISVNSCIAQFVTKYETMIENHQHYNLGHNKFTEATIIRFEESTKLIKENLKQVAAFNKCIALISKQIGIKELSKLKFPFAEIEKAASSYNNAFKSVYKMIEEEKQAKAELTELQKKYDFLDYITFLAPEPKILDQLKARLSSIDYLPFEEGEKAFTIAASAVKLVTEKLKDPTIFDDMTSEIINDLINGTTLRGE